MAALRLILALVLLAGCSGDQGGRTMPSPSATAPSADAPSSASATPSAPAPRSGQPRLDLVGRFEQPTHVVAPPGDPRLFVVEQGGRIRLVKGGRVVRTPFLDIVAEVRSGGEQGLLSMAFAPDYATSRLFYVNHNASDGAVVVAEYRVGADPDRADPASRRELLRIPKPFSNHNGGLLVFDADGMLLLSMGDGGGGNDPDNNAQRLDTLLGKLLRIDPRRPGGGRPYGIPPGNPFVGRAGARPEIWAFGLRNPWRYAFDGETGDLYIGDVGQNAVEEIDAVPRGRQAGANYGWRVYEGRRRNFPDETPNRAGPLVEPVHQLDHGGGRCSITAGVVYRGSVTALRGRFLFGDYCAGTLWSMPAGTRAGPEVTTLRIRAPNVTSFGVDGFGEVYVASGGGEVWRISA